MVPLEYTVIVASLNPKGSVARTTLALDVVGAWVGQGKHIVDPRPDQPIRGRVGTLRTDREELTTVGRLRQETKRALGPIRARSPQTAAKRWVDRRSVPIANEVPIISAGLNQRCVDTQAMSDRSRGRR